MSAERKILLVAASYNREKKLSLGGQDAQWNGKLVTVDINPLCKPDVLHDMGKRPYPFKDAEFDEIHAYDCLEHWGVQGDWRAWFDEMAEYHRMLKPGGQFAAIVPQGDDRFADPGHTRFINLNHFLFLSQHWYQEQVAMKTSASDYRWYWKHDFQPVAANMIGEPAHHLGIILQKPGQVMPEDGSVLARLARRLLTVR